MRTIWILCSLIQGLNNRRSLPDTYSADFQKCPGCESLRLSLGSFSSMSARWVKVGLSLRSYAQHAERISCDDKKKRSESTVPSIKLIRFPSPSPTSEAPSHQMAPETHVYLACMTHRCFFFFNSQ